jgi:hypothetical protein
MADGRLAGEDSKAAVPWLACYPLGNPNVPAIAAPASRRFSFMVQLLV